MEFLLVLVQVLVVLEGAGKCCWRQLEAVKFFYQTFLKWLIYVYVEGLAFFRMSSRPLTVSLQSWLHNLQMSLRPTAVRRRDNDDGDCGGGGDGGDVFILPLVSSASRPSFMIPIQQRGESSFLILHIAPF